MDSTDPPSSSSPPGALARPALVARLAAARVGLIVAPGGFGKTTLRRELAAALGSTEVVVELEPGANPDLLAGVLAAALRRAGLSPVAEALGAATDDLGDLLGRLLDGRPDPVLLAVDDAHHLDIDGWRTLSSVADALPAPHHLLVGTRHAPADLGPALTSALRVGIDDLRFDVDQVVALADGRLDRAAAVAIVELTDGWPAAVAMAIARARRGPTGVLRRRTGRDVLAALVGELLADATDDVRRAAAVVARLPRFTEELVDELVGAGSLMALQRAGVPVISRDDGWCEFADPVREILEGPPLERDQARAAALYFADVGELAMAFAVLDSAEGRDGFAEALADRPWHELADLGLASTRAAVDLLGDDRLRRHPRLAVKAGWVAEGRDVDLRRRLLALALDVLDAGDPLRATVLAEQARDRAKSGDIDGAETLAREALSIAPEGDAVSRGRALYTLGLASTMRATPAALEQARLQLEQSAVLLRLAREPRWEADVRLRLGYAVLFLGGRVADGVEHLRATLELLAQPDRARGVVLTHYADALDTLGRGTEAESAVNEAIAIGRRIGDEQVLWFATWSMVKIVARRGDVDGARAMLAEATRHLGVWADEPQGTEFFIETLDSLACAGDLDTLRERYPVIAERARGQGLDETLRPLTARYDALVGDPDAAVELLRSLDGAAWAVESDRWGRRLLEARAEQRRGDLDRARVLVAEALAEAESMGLPDLPDRYERYLIGLLAECRAPASTPASTGVRLQLLGGFRLESGADDVTPQPGHPAQLVKLLALRGATPVEEMIELLWPEVDVATGRSRLRNLLNRLRSRSGDVVLRDGELLVLASAVEIDVNRFEVLAQAAVDAGPDLAAGAARLAVAAYGGVLLPADQFEDWAAAPRERLARRVLRLHDVLVDDAADRGDVDEAVRQLEAGVAIDPLDESRLVRAADLLLAGGGRLAARRMVERALAVLDDLGLAPRGRLLTLMGEVGLSR